MNNHLRPSYLDRIKPYMGKQLIKVLTGQRRTGKSYLLRQLMDMIRAETPTANIVYINKEDIQFDFLQDYTQLHAYVESRGTAENNYLFVDEIQEISGFERAIRSLLASGSYDIYITGSNAHLLSSDLATLISGRYIEFRVHSLSYLEFLHFHQLPNAVESLLRYLKYGGMPYLAQLPPADEQVFEYLKNIYHTVFFKDIIERFNIRNVSFLTDLTRYLAQHCGSLLSVHSIEKYLKAQRIKVSNEMIMNYLNFMERAYFIHRVRRYDISAKRIFEIGEKVFFEDLGMRNAVASYTLNDMHKLMENAVFKHLIFSGYEVFVGVNKTAEIDFVATRHHETIYVQVAYRIESETTLLREFGNLLAVKDNYPKYVVLFEEMQVPNSYEGIVCLSLREFLSLTL